MPSTTYLTILLILVLFPLRISTFVRFCLPRIFNSIFFPSSCCCSAITGLSHLSWQKKSCIYYMNRSLLLPFSLIQITYCATVWMCVCVCVKAKGIQIGHNFNFQYDFFPIFRIHNTHRHTSHTRFLLLYCSRKHWHGSIISAPKTESCEWGIAENCCKFSMFNAK